MTEADTGNTTNKPTPEENSPQRDIEEVRQEFQSRYEFYREFQAEISEPDGQKTLIETYRLDLPRFEDKAVNLVNDFTSKAMMLGYRSRLSTMVLPTQIPQLYFFLEKPVSGTDTEQSS